MRAALITEIISHYRLPVFNEIALQGIEFKAFYLQENVPQRQWQVYKQDIRHDFEVLQGIHFSTGPSRHAYINPTVGAALSRYNPDAIVCGGYNHTAALQALLFAKSHRKPFILWSESTPRDTRSNRRIYEMYKRWIVRQSDRFVAAGTAARQYLISLGAPPARVWIAPDSVDNVWFDKQADQCASASGSVTRLLFAGRLVPEKGIPILLQAVRLLQERFAIELVIAGDGPERAALEVLCSSYELRRISFTGFVQPKELARYYWSADVFVFPSLSDPWGLVLNEAMAAGLPIISSTAPGAVDDLLIEGYNGFTFQPNDVNSLVCALERFLALSVQTRQQMGQNSRQLIQYFSPERCARGFVEAIRGEPNRVREEYERFRKTVKPIVAE